MSTIPYASVPDAELSEAQLREKYEPVKIGPSWQTNEDGSWALPEHTLGWQIAGWMAKYLDGPNGERGFNLTDEQLRFLLWFYAVDEDGEFAYRNGVLQRLKGWGKDPLAAAVCLVELVGPCRFSHWDADGDPVAVQHPNPLVQVAATGQEHTETMMTMLPMLITEELKATYRMEVGKEVIHARNGRARLKAVTSNPKALEGFRVSFTLLNETHLWYTSNQGVGMYRVIRRNAAKVDGRFLALTNAFQPGEESVAEQMRRAADMAAAGKAVKTKTLYDSLEAPAHAPMEPTTLPIILDMVRGDAKWIKIANLLDEILDPTNPISTSRRFYFNQIVADEDALYDAKMWDPLGIKAELEIGDEIVLGFDGGKTDDATALVAIRLRDNVAFLLGLWQRPEGPRKGRRDVKWQESEETEGWSVPRYEVDQEVRQAFKLYKVAGFYADVALWESNIAKWELDHGEDLRVKASPHQPIAWDMRGKKRQAVMANERLWDTIALGAHDVGEGRTSALYHDGNPELRQHVLNVRRRASNYGVSFGKESEDSPLKIDAYAALLLAFECLTDLRQRGSEKKRTGHVWFM